MYQGSLLQYLIDKNNSLSEAIRETLNYNEDGGFTSIYSFRDTVFVNRSDSLGRICPSFIKQESDLETKKSVFPLSGKDFWIVNDSISIKDYLISDSVINLRKKVICEGSAEGITSNEVET